MAAISVVVPIYNVERYLGECLQSIADQTFADLEVVMVNDGSTDGSPAIAAAFAERDPRFKLVHQENGGLSKARNTGTAAATGEFLAFVDSDDVLPANAYQLLHGALDETGSDFATGNFHRMTPEGLRKVTFASRAFERTRLATHVTEFWPLLADRTAWNKLFRRSFWDASSFRFPEGVVHEDIPVAVPAHFRAKSVDVIAEPVYYYRLRAGEGLSITQRRLDQRALVDRMTAVEYVSGFLAREKQREGKRRYDQSVVFDDLRYYLNVLDSADDDYRQLFLDRVNAFLDQADRHVYDRLPAIDRLKWYLVRRRALPELLEVLRFFKEDLAETPAVRDGGRWYGDYPFRTDRRLRIPKSVYRLDEELILIGEIEEIRLDGTQLTIRGFAYIPGIGAPTKTTQHFRVIAVRPGRFRPVRLKIPEVTLKTVAVERPDVTPTGRLLSDPAWSGFEATVDTRAFRGPRGWRTGVWNIYVNVRAGRLRRRRAQFGAGRLKPLRAVELPAPDEISARATPVPGGGVAVEIADEWARLRGYALLEGDVVELRFDARLAGGGKLRLEATQPGGGSLTRTYDVERPGADGPVAHLTARVPLADILAAPPPPRRRTAREDDREVWPLELLRGKRRLPLIFPSATSGESWRFGDLEVSLAATKRGEAAIIERALRPRVTELGWVSGGELEISGEIPPELAADELVLVSRRRVEHQRWPLERGGADRFAARVTPGVTRSLAGELPLAEGTWDLCVCAGGEQDESRMIPVTVDADLYDGLPAAETVARKRMAVGMTFDDLAILEVRRDLDNDENGRWHAHRLEREVYRPGRREPLRDAVVYASFGGTEYSDGPRAIYEELVRRGTPLEHLWVVRDARARVPDGATVVRASGREHYEALARARYVVTNDDLPPWYERRADQLCLQTWHGTPLQRLGLDIPEMSKATRPMLRRFDRQTANWQYFLSPNGFSTPILRRAYDLDGAEILELGSPRDDALAGARREEMTRRVRERIGVPEGNRVVLYAPYYREHATGGRGGYQLDLGLDLERVRAAIGEDSVLLFRKHPLVSDIVPADGDFVLDVSSYPDAVELLLAADVLVTDYSPLMFDFASTGRPMLFYAYDLEAYREEVSNFYIDYESALPGPILRTSDEVADALRDIDSVAAEYADRYRAFASEFCGLDDGNAAARVVDRLFTR